MCAQERGHSLTVTRRRFVQGVAAAVSAKRKFSQSADLQGITIELATRVLLETYMQRIRYESRRKKDLWQALEMSTKDVFSVGDSNGNTN
jgi:hypothetical protein